MTIFLVSIGPGHTVTTRSHREACAIVSRWARQNVHASFRTIYVALEN